jgi:hypothetical protein
VNPEERQGLAEAVRAACLKAAKGERLSRERRHKEVPAVLPAEQDAEREALTERVREVCFRVAEEAFQDASASGLCHEGAVEVSLGAVSMLDLKALLAALEQGKKPG